MQTVKEPRLIDIFDEIARGSNLDQSLTLIAHKAAADLKAPTCKIWVVKHGDICERCPLAEVCTNRQMCLHLIAASGTSLEKEYPRIPLSILNSSLIVRGGIADFKENNLSGEKLFGLQSQEYHSNQSSYAIYPLRGISGTVGLIGIFSDTQIEVEGVEILAQLAPLAVAAIRIAELQARCDSLRFKLEKETADALNLTLSENRVKELEAANNQLKDELNNLQSEYVVRMAAQQDAEKRLQQLEEEAENQLQEVEQETENHLQQLEKENARLQQLVSWYAPQGSLEAQAAADSLTESAENLKDMSAALAQANSKAEELETRLATLETANQELAEHNASLTDNVENLESALRLAEDARASLEQEQAQTAAESQNRELDELRQTLEQTHSEKANLLTERERLHSEMAEMQLANSSLKEEISRLNDLHKAASEQLATTETQVSEQSQELSKKLASAEAQIAELNAKLEETLPSAERLAELVKENASLVEENTTIKEEKNQLDDAVRTLDLVVPRLEETTNNLRNRIELNERLRTEIEHKNRDILLENQRLKLKAQAELKMFADLSHELRTPVNAIIGFASLILDDASVNLSEKHRHSLERISKNSRDLADFINNILDYSKIEAGLMDVYSEPVNIKEVVERAIEIAEGLKTNKFVKLSVEFDEGLPTIRTDKTKLQQILLNLLSNALKFTKEGEIKVAVLRAGDRRVRLTVSDTGIGIAESNLSKIFEEFRQLRQTSYTAKAGTGLGLPITRRLVVLLGGEISVSSTVGEGTVFTFTLPTEIESSVAPTAETAGQIVDPDRTALVISNDAATLYLIRKYLSEADYSAATTSEPAQGLEVVRLAKPSLIAVDLDGLDNPTSLLNQLAGYKDGGKLIAFSNNPEMERRSLNTGADKFLPKPLSRTALTDALKKSDAPKEEFILVVDDDPDALEITKTMLESRGHLVKTAKDGLEAIGEITRNEPVAVVLDLMMPEMDGIEVAYRLQSNPRWREIPIVLLTARDLSNEERSALNYDSVQIIQKGTFSREELMTGIDSAISAPHHQP